MRLVDIQGLTVGFAQDGGQVQAVRGVSLHVDPGESLGIVGESGSGKSVTCMAALRLLSVPPARIAADRLDLAGVDVLRADKRTMAGLRGRVAAMIFQDPMTAFDPVFTIGHQIAETVRAHRSVSRQAARAEAEALLTRVEIRNARALLDAYPHQLSGGMLQRAMIAMALSCRPQVLFADEPTTALDVTIQAQILQLIKALQAEFGMGLVMVTHDLGVIAETVDRVVVMYGGRVMEQAGVQDLFDDPRHPYTQALLASRPGQAGPDQAGPEQAGREQAGREQAGNRLAGKRRLTEIAGASPNPAAPPAGCPFHPRCPQVVAQCSREAPPLRTVGEGQQAACWRLE